MKFILLLVLFVVVAQGKHIRKRYVEDDEFIGDDLEKRAAGNDQQSIFPKFPGDEESEFEQEVQEDKQELPVEEVQPDTTENVVEDKEKYLQPEAEIIGENGQWFGKGEEDNEIEVTTKRPWYKKVHGFFRDQYDYVKNKLRFGRGDDDFYVNS